MAVAPTRKPLAAALRLEPFDPAHAELVASWIRNEQEALWFAPKTPPPVTARDIRRWSVPGHEPLQVVQEVGAAPLAYGEVNVLNAAGGHFWLGHLIVDPARRGRGVGQKLTRLLLARGFSRYGARRVSLVVFPGNRQAIACYRAAGMYADGYEEHELRAWGRRVRLIRMVATQAD